MKLLRIQGASSGLLCYRFFGADPIVIALQDAKQTLQPWGWASCRNGAPRSVGPTRWGSLRFYSICSSPNHNGRFGRLFLQSRHVTRHRCRRQRRFESAPCQSTVCIRSSAMALYFFFTAVRVSLVRVSCHRCRRAPCIYAYVRPSCQRPEFIVILRRVHVVRRRYVITAAAALVVGVISSHIRVPTPERRRVIPTVFAVVLNSAPPTKHTAKLHFICRVRRAIVVSACKPSVPLFRRKVRRTRVHPTIPDRGRHHHRDMHVTAVSHSCIRRRVKHKSILETDNRIMCSFIK